MAESSTVTILRNKVEEIGSHIRAYEREIGIARKNLVAVQMTLAVFQCENGAPYHSQKPVSLSKLFRRGKLPGVVLAALKDHPEGLDTRELAAICLKHRDLDTDDVVLRRSMAMKLCKTLDKLRLRGGIDKAGMRAGVIVWRDWQRDVTAFVKTKMKEADVTYVEMAKRLKKHGFKETEASLTMKLKRGAFAATFLMACLAALELDGVRLEDL